MLILNYAESVHSTQILNDIKFFHNSANEFDSTIDDRLPDFMIPDHYHIKLEQQESTTVKENKKFFLGQCNISVRLVYPVSIIRLHAQKTHIRLNETIFYKINSSKPGIVPHKTTYNRENHIYQFKFKEELLNGYYIVYITFVSFLDNNEENFYELKYKDIRGENE